MNLENVLLCAIWSSFVAANSTETISAQLYSGVGLITAANPTRNIENEVSQPRVSLTYPHQDFTFDINYVHKGKLILYSNIMLYQSTILTTAESVLLIHAENEGFVYLGRFLNLENAITEILGSGDLDVKMKDLRNREDGSLKMLVERTLDFETEEILNWGDISIQAQKLFMTCFGDLHNHKLILIRAREWGELSFDKILNEGRMEVHGADSISPFTFGSLDNIGHFHYGYEGHKDQSVYARGSISNSGTITIISHHVQNFIMIEGQIDNNGLICLQSAVFRHSTSMIGEGCWGLSDGAVIKLLADREFALTQLIILLDESARIFIEKFGEFEKVYQVYGFHMKSEIWSKCDIHGYSYDSETGHLRVSLNKKEVIIFDIGMGYEDKFVYHGRLLKYHGKPAPGKETPEHCKCTS